MTSLSISAVLLILSIARVQAAEAARSYFAGDVKTATEAHIHALLDDEQIFEFKDDVTGELLQLKFVTIHDPVRKMGGEVYFACTDFHVVGEPKRLYDLDFWLNAKTGELKVFQSKVHKEPRKSLLYGWYKQPRYTFVGDDIHYLYK